MDKPAATWETFGEALGIWFAPRTLRRTLTIAAIVGVILSLINQGHLIFRGEATAATWVRVAFNFVVPFCVSSTGFLTATHRKRS